MHVNTQQMNMKRTIDQVNDNNFMHIFKYYKGNNNKPSFENVISFEKDRVTEKVGYVLMITYIRISHVQHVSVNRMRLN